MQHVVYQQEAPIGQYKVQVVNYNCHCDASNPRFADPHRAVRFRCYVERFGNTYMFEGEVVDRHTPVTAFKFAHPGDGTNTDLPTDIQRQARQAAAAAAAPAAAAAAAAPPIPRAQNEIIEEDTGIAVGIDLGTTYTCVGFYDPVEGVRIIPDSEGRRTTRSVVGYRDADECIVGTVAYSSALGGNVVSEAKRLIGRKFTDPEVQQHIGEWPFKVERDPTRDSPQIVITVEGNEHMLSPEQVSSQVLKAMKQQAEAFLGGGAVVNKAVITVPAYFNDEMRRATTRAGELAGLRVLRILNEPTAAAIAYGLAKRDALAAGQQSGGAGSTSGSTSSGRGSSSGGGGGGGGGRGGSGDGSAAASSSAPSTVLVFDLGGGTFDVSLLVIDNDAVSVKATGGDTHLGGVDFDNKLVEHCLKLFKQEHNNPAVDADPHVRLRLRFACEKAKRLLSTKTEVKIAVDNLFERRNFLATVTRAQFEKLNEPDFKRMMGIVDKVLKDGGKARADVHEVLLVGGSTRIPEVRRMLGSAFRDRTPAMFVNVDEVVAQGATLLAAILTGGMPDDGPSLVLKDVTPMSLGVEVAGGAMHTLIKRNSRIPTSKTMNFTTQQDDQPEVPVRVLEGDRPKASDNQLLGEFSLQNIQPMPKGMPVITVSFRVDENGTLNVTATDGTSGTRKGIVVSSATMLSHSATAKLAAAADFRAVDMAFEQTVSARFRLDAYCTEVINATEHADRVGGLLTEVECLKLNNTARKMREWVTSHPIAKAAEYAAKRMELRKHPMLNKLWRGEHRDRAPEYDVDAVDEELD